MRVFHFGSVNELPDGSVGEFALHIQCPWRVDSSTGIVTGRSDLWKPPDLAEGFSNDAWDYEKDGNLQDEKIYQLLGEYDARTKSFYNHRDRLYVESARVSEKGGFVLDISDGYHLSVFPDGSRGEDWRLFRPTSEEEHFVISGGEIE